MFLLNHNAHFWLGGDYLNIQKLIYFFLNIKFKYLKHNTTDQKFGVCTIVFERNEYFYLARMH